MLFRSTTGKYEKIHLSLQTRRKFANAGKPRKVVKPKNLPLIKRFDPEYQALMAREHEEECARIRMLHEIHTRRERLLDRLAKEEERRLTLAE